MGRFIKDGKFLLILKKIQDYFMEFFRSDFNNLIHMINKGNQKRVYSRIRSKNVLGEYDA